MCSENNDTYAFMNDIEAQMDKANAEVKHLLEDGKLNLYEYTQLMEVITSAK